MNNKQPDKYGFIVPRGNSSFKQVSALQFNARMEKWESMISSWDLFRQSRRKLLKKRVRKGIPDPLRGRVWLLIADCGRVRKNYPNHLYFRYSNIEEDPPCMLTIEKDLDRTYPGHELYRTAEGQLSLRNILRAYAFFDPEIGYCQGMGYVAGIARMYMDEESAFWMLVSLMRLYQLREMFKQGMDHVYRCFYVGSYLLRNFEPRVWNALRDSGVVPQIYATQWFMTIYSSFPIETVLRIWDCYLLEGPKILFRVFVGFFRMNKNELNGLTFEMAIRKIRELEGVCDCDGVLKAAFSLSLSKKKLSDIDREYETSPDSNILVWER
jgi:TBC1 domain family member 10